MKRREQGRFGAGRGFAPALFVVTAMASTTAAAATPFTAFESGQVRPQHGADERWLRSATPWW
jgi:hypothetical protein